MFQYQRFFEEHEDGDAKQRGLFLIGVIDGLREALSLQRFPPIEMPKQFEKLPLLDAMTGYTVWRTLKRRGGCRTTTADELGTSRPTVIRWIKRFKEIGLVVPLLLALLMSGCATRPAQESQSFMLIGDHRFLPVAAAAPHWTRAALESIDRLECGHKQPHPVGEVGRLISRRDFTNAYSADPMFVYTMIGVINRLQLQGCLGLGATNKHRRKQVPPPPPTPPLPPRQTR